MTYTRKTGLSAEPGPPDKKAGYRTALERSRRLCASAEHCISDIRSKIERWGLVSGDEALKITDQLIREGFIDEKRFAHAYVNDKLRYSKWGRIKITYNMRMRHIPGEIIEEALNNIDEREYRDTAAKIVASLLRTKSGEDRRARNARIVRSMQGRGFEIGLTLELLKTGN